MTYEDCTKKCSEVGGSIITTNLLDTLLQRSKENKLGFLCHFVCLKTLNLRNVKRNGRWGFRPLLGMNEFFSSTFSLINLFVNIYSYHKTLRPRLGNDHISNMYVIQHYISNFAFISSFLFHVHENTVTRYLDYFFAFLVLTYALYVSFVRVIRIFMYVGRGFNNNLKSLFVAFYSYHVYRMLNIEFDYAYNKLACILIVTFIFINHFIIYVRYRNMPHSKNILFFTLLFFIAGMIEIQDIPPYAYLVDSHAMWHLISCLSTPFYALFWSEDIRVNGV
ncbi:Post-GPI attachment to proteins factor 3 [Nosema granulosis]|uniref:Post-GPI attachment to proteins factor 3 n=1 Tax=Nosema granulosis TaxID=83296 RepID=A0A9P6H0J2_9MICR|nr:Post-GPI attachment to proteins factor 3 [Nosema granulosis]